jgi:hypothetical protein
VSSSFALLSAAQDIQAVLVQPKLLEALINQHFGKQAYGALTPGRMAVAAARAEIRLNRSPAFLEKDHGSARFSAG